MARLNAAQLHLMINTLPPIISCLALVVMIIAFWWRSEMVKRLALLMIGSVAPLIAPVYYTGQKAVVVVGNLPGVPLSLIGRHQESVFLTWIAAGIASAVALSGFIACRKRPLPTWLIAVTLAVSLLTDGLILRTAHLGGSIRHPEVRFEAERTESIANQE